MTEHELVEYLSFQAYYGTGRQIIGRWLTKTPEDDAFVLLAQQVEDEALHFQYIMRCLAPLGVTSLDNYKPEPEWEEWIDVWYPSGDDTIEPRVGPQRHRRAGRVPGVHGDQPRLPDDVTKVFERIIPDEQFHMKLGKQLILRYCTSDDQQARVVERVKHGHAEGEREIHLVRRHVPRLDECRPVPDVLLDGSDDGGPVGQPGGNGPGRAVLGNLHDPDLRPRRGTTLGWEEVDVVVEDLRERRASRDVDHLAAFDPAGDDDRVEVAVLEGGNAIALVRQQRLADAVGRQGDHHVRRHRLRAIRRERRAEPLLEDVEGIGHGAEV